MILLLFFNGYRHGQVKRFAACADIWTNKTLLFYLSNKISTMFNRKLFAPILIIFFVNCRTDVVQTKAEFVPNNKVQNIKMLNVLAPKNYQQKPPEGKELANDAYYLNLYARQFVRGDMIYLELLPRDKSKFGGSPQISVNGTILRLKKSSWGYRGYFAIHPENENRKVDIELKLVIDGFPRKELHTFTLDEKKFPESKSALDIGKFSRTDIPIDIKLQNRIIREYKEKVNIFKLDNPDMITKVLAYPRDIHMLTSPFYEKRIIERYEIKNGQKVAQKPGISYHGGLDFYARLGDPVFSMASGKVVLADDLYYEGNCVMIDHGSRVLSVFMHLSKMAVKPGQTVKAGELLGYAGSTGMSTGPHLHISLYINQIPADPLSLLFLPIRD